MQVEKAELFERRELGQAGIRNSAAHLQIEILEVRESGESLKPPISDLGPRQTKRFQRLQPDPCR